MEGLSWMPRSIIASLEFQRILLSLTGSYVLKAFFCSSVPFLIIWSFCWSWNRSSRWGEIITQTTKLWSLPTRPFVSHIVIVSSASSFLPSKSSSNPSGSSPNRRSLPARLKQWPIQRQRTSSFLKPNSTARSDIQVLLFSALSVIKKPILSCIWNSWMISFRSSDWLTLVWWPEIWGRLRRNICSL